MDESLILGTDPNSDYDNTMRRMQRVIYSGYKNQHGLSALCVLTSDGLYHIYGPCSMQRSDCLMMNMSVG